MSDIGVSKLIEEAEKAAQNAQPKISGFSVGAALETRAGVFQGCNIEFDNYSNTLHAEEVALATAIIHHQAGLDKVAIAVWTASDTLDWPCGRCRQSLMEYCGPHLLVVSANPHTHECKRLSELYPEPFLLARESSDE